MTERETPPALTAEEWAKAGPHPYVIGDGEGLFVVCESRPNDFTVGRHGTAAVCLYGQPFGFTPEMLDALDTLMQHMDGPDDLALVRSMAAKIRALLPPA